MLTRAGKYSRDLLAGLYMLTKAGKYSRDLLVGLYQEKR